MAKKPESEGLLQLGGLQLVFGIGSIFWLGDPAMGLLWIAVGGALIVCAWFKRKKPGA